MISFEEFQKLDLRVAKILAAERIEESEKLIRLSIDFGDEQRQIVAGIGAHYAPEILSGKEIVVVANLEPRVIKGIESQGMLLAASCEEKLVLLTPEKEIPPGSKVR